MMKQRISDSDEPMKVSELRPESEAMKGAGNSSGTKCKDPEAGTWLWRPRKGKVVK